jgi:putative transposase
MTAGSARSPCPASAFCPSMTTPAGSDALLAKGRAKILFATVSHHAGRWWVALNVEAADLHPAHVHVARADDDHRGWVGVDRGLSAFLVAATAAGNEVARIEDAPKALASGMLRQRHLARKLSRKRQLSRNYRRAARQLARHHNRCASIRRHFLHRVSNELVKTHDRLVIEDLNVAGMLRNHRLAQAISDASWSELARQLRYKAQWRGSHVVVADRYYPSSQICSRCRIRNHQLRLADRVFRCSCGYSADRDLNAAINLAHWAENCAHLEPRTPKQGGRAIKARRRDGADRHPMRVGETSPNDAGTDVQPAPEG